MEGVRPGTPVEFGITDSVQGDTVAAAGIEPDTHNKPQATALTHRSLSIEAPSPEDLPDLLGKPGSPLHRNFLPALKQFARRTMGIDFPTNNTVQRWVLDYVRILVQASHQTAEEIDTEHLRQTFALLKGVFPQLFFTDSPASYQLVEALFDFGIIKPDARDFPGYIFHPAYNFFKNLKTLPFRLFHKLYGNHLQSAEFSQVMSDRSHLIRFANKPDPDYLAYWCHHSPDSEQRLKKALVAIADHSSRPFFETLEYSPPLLAYTFHNIVKPELSRDHWQDELLSEACLRFLNNALFFYPQEINQELELFIRSLPEDKKSKLMRHAVLQGHHHVVQLMINLPVPVAALGQWRDDSGRTILHPKYLEHWEASESAACCLKQLLQHDDVKHLLSVKDNHQHTPLESLIAFKDLKIGIDIESPLLDTLIDSSLECIPLAWCEDAFRKKDMLECYGLGLMSKLVQKGANPQSCFSQDVYIRRIDSDTKDAATIQVANQLNHLLTTYKPLKERDVQRAFFSQLVTLPLEPSAIYEMTRSLDIDVRGALMVNPCDSKFDFMWKSQVAPVPRPELAFGQAVYVDLPWTPFLTTVVSTYSPPKQETLLNEWATKTAVIPNPESVEPLGYHLDAVEDSGIYGRSCFFSLPGNSRVQRFKFRKKMEDGTAEPVNTLFGEPVKLRLLREWQKSGRLPLKTRFPEPQGVYRVDNFKQWLEKAPLGQLQKDELEQSVWLEEDGSALVYAYSTATNEIYHEYPYTRGPGGNDEEFEQSLESVKMAAHDLGLLTKAGLAATVLPMYHDVETQRKLVILTQLMGLDCPGALMDWNYQATNYPNISPGVGLRDYADIYPLSEVALELGKKLSDTPENKRRVAMEQTAAEFLCLVLSMARTFEHKLDHKNPEIVQQLEREIKELSTAFFGQAFNLDPEEISGLLERYDITHNLAMEIAYWCNTQEHPDYLEDMKKGRLSSDVYPEAKLQEMPPSQLLMILASIASKNGFRDSRFSQGVKLGYTNGPFPLLQLNKLITLMMSCYVCQAK